MGCAGVDHKKLTSPKKLSCIDIREPLEYISDKRISKTFLPGPYWSELVNKHGTFYRAPLGGIEITYKTTKVSRYRNGGIFVPFDRKKPFKSYEYYSAKPVPSFELPKGFSCKDFALNTPMPDPSYYKYNEKFDISAVLYPSKIARKQKTIKTPNDSTNSSINAASQSAINSNPAISGAVGSAAAVAGGVYVAALVAESASEAAEGQIDQFDIESPSFTKQFRQNLKLKSFLSTKQVKKIRTIENTINKTKDEIFCKKAGNKKKTRCENLESDASK